MSLGAGAPRSGDATRAKAAGADSMIYALSHLYGGGA